MPLLCSGVFLTIGQHYVYVKGNFYKGQKYQIEGLGRFKHARALHLPFLSLCFYTCQIINLNETTQLTFLQIRNQWNIILCSRLDIQEFGKPVESFTEDVNLHIHRVYPKVKTPNGKEMYLPREFSWQCEKNGKIIFELYAQSRGDYKFGLAAGYVGSFQYQLSWNEQCLQGEGDTVNILIVAHLDGKKRIKTRKF